MCSNLLKGVLLYKTVGVPSRRLKTFFYSILNNVPPWRVSPSGDAIKFNFPWHYLRKYFSTCWQTNCSTWLVHGVEGVEYERCQRNPAALLFSFWFPLHLKYGFCNKSFILNAPLVSCPIPVIRFGWVCCCTHPKQMTGIGQSVLKQSYIEIDNYWKWATDQRCIQNKWLVMKSIL